MSESTGCDCAKLDDRNKKKRDSLREQSNAESVVGSRNKAGARTGAGTTVTSMCFKQGSGAPDVRIAHNSQKALEFDKGLEKGGTTSDREKGRSKLCKKAKHKHKAPYKQYSGHTEARLLAGLSKGTGAFPTSGTLTLKIDWRSGSKNGKSSPMPCTSCHKLLCGAVACGLNVYLCDKNNKKKKLSKKHCPATDDSYKELEKTMKPTKPKIG